jgi:gluconate 2-dehydrogenase
MSKPTLVVTRRIRAELIESLSQVFEVTHNQETDTPTTPDRMRTLLAQAQYLFCTVADTVNAEVLGAAPHLKMIATGAVGTNNIDLGICRSRSIAVSNTPDVLTETTADFAWALLMATARRVSESERYVRSGSWDGWSFDQFSGRDVYGARLGVLGMGRIGSAVARRAAGFGMTVLYHNRKPASEAGAAQWVDKATLMRESDFLVIVVPYSPETHHLVGPSDLALMKPTACLVNIARGGVVDDAALADALESRRIWAAGLDVFEGEPRLNPRLLALDQVVLTPHIASSSVQTRGRMMQLAVDNLMAHQRGLALLTPVL